MIGNTIFGLLGSNPVEHINTLMVSMHNALQLAELSSNAFNTLVTNGSVHIDVAKVGGSQSLIDIITATNIGLKHEAITYIDTIWVALKTFNSAFERSAILAEIDPGISGVPVDIIDLQRAEIYRLKSRMAKTSIIQYNIGLLIDVHHVGGGPSLVPLVPEVPVMPVVPVAPILPGLHSLPAPQDLPAPSAIQAWPGSPTALSVPPTLRPASPTSVGLGGPSWPSAGSGLGWPGPSRPA